MKNSLLLCSLICISWSVSASDSDSTKAESPVTEAQALDDTIFMVVDSAIIVEETIVEEVIEAPYYSDELVFFDYNELPLTLDMYQYQVANLNFEIPMDFNHLVKEQIDYYSTRWQPKLKEILTTSQFYFPIYERILLENGMPAELKYLSIVESALNPYARSRTGAVGAWQFMPATGRIYGLEVNYMVDERRSLEKSTEAAANYLRTMHNQYGDWLVAIASYNCGPGNVRKAMRNSGSTDFWGMYNYLPRETQNYVPKFIAMAYVMNYCSEFGITPKYVENMKSEYIQVRCHSNMDFGIIAEKLEMEPELLMSYNPELKKQIIPYKNNEYMLNVPIENSYLFDVYTDEILSLSQVKYQERLAAEAAKPKPKYHVVKKGECLPIIARKYGCTSADLRRWNNIKGSLIFPNQKLKIYP